MSLRNLNVSRGGCQIGQRPKVPEPWRAANRLASGDNNLARPHTDGSTYIALYPSGAKIYSGLKFQVVQYTHLQYQLEFRNFALLACLRIDKADSSKR